MTKIMPVSNNRFLRLIDLTDFRTPILLIAYLSGNKDIMDANYYGITNKTLQ